MNRPAKRHVAGKPSALIKAVSFQAVSFHDAKLDRQIIVLYSLGSDGIVREFTGGEWKAFPITE